MFDLIKASGTRLVPGDVRAGENKEEERKKQEPEPQTLLAGRVDNRTPPSFVGPYMGYMRVVSPLDEYSI